MAISDKKIFFSNGSLKYIRTWGEYTIISRFSVFPKPENLTMEQAASSLVNPLTVKAFIVECQDRGIKPIVHSASALLLGRMLVRACKNNDIPLINVVRRKEQVAILKDIGAENIINSSDQDYQDQLSKKIQELQQMSCYDACGS